MSSLSSSDNNILHIEEDSATPGTSTQFIVDFVQVADVSEGHQKTKMKSKSNEPLNGKKVGTMCLYVVDLLYSGRLSIIRVHMKFFLLVMSLALTTMKKLSSAKLGVELVPTEYLRKMMSCKQNHQSSTMDFDRVVCVTSKFAQKCLLQPFHWVRIKRSYETENEDLGFICMIIGEDQVASQKISYCNNVIKMTSTAEYNLRKSLQLSQHDVSNSLSIRLYPLLFNPYMNSFLSYAFVPPPAKTVQLSSVQSASNIIISSEKQDSLLKLHFTNDKYISAGDVISVPISLMSENEDSASEVEFLNFIVDKIDGGVGPGSGGKAWKIFSVSTKGTSLYLTGNYVNTYKPKINHHGISTKYPFSPINLVPEPLESYCEELFDWFRLAFTSLPLCEDLWPTVLIHGPVGSGKYSICKAVSLRLGINFYVINAVNLVGDTSAYTEAKLKALQQKIKSLSPCLTIVKNIHLIGKDKEGQEDKRTILAFNDLLTDIKQEIYNSQLNSGKQTNNNLTAAAFIVGLTCHPEKISLALSNCFLYQLSTNTTVSALHAASTIDWIVNKSRVCILDDVDIEQWAKDNSQTSKRNLSDWKAILSLATREAYKENSTKISNTPGDHAKCTGSTRQSYEGVALSRQHLQQGLGDVDKLLKDSIENVHVPTVSWDDIGGLEDIKSELINSVQLPLKFPHLFAKGLKRSGTLIFGPPGTGKTLIAKAVASEFKLNFISVKGPELLNMYVGQSEQNVREVFERARDCAPCVVFFDELDSLAPNRGRSGDSGGVMDRVVSQILAELDGTHSTPNVFVIGATNRPDLIDPALLRPGRFDKLLYVGIINDPKTKEKILLALTRKFQLNSDVNLKVVSEKLPNGMTGADLYALCSDAYITAVSRCIEMMDKGEIELVVNVIVTMADFEDALSRATTSLSENEQMKYEQMKSLMR